jgi:murein DD-endopeptidase MepM/ murein hydrolase activator NlpD
VKPLARYIINQGFSLLHPGIDLEADRDESILPIMNGVVVEASWNVFGYGNTVVVNHKNGYASRYAHLAKIFVRPGEEISNDMVLGLAGSTGHSTGTHLHLEIYDHGIPINPRGLLE